MCRPLLFFMGRIIKFNRQRLATYAASGIAQPASSVYAELNWPLGRQSDEAGFLFSSNWVGYHTYVVGILIINSPLSCLAAFKHATFLRGEQWKHYVG